MYCSYCWGYFRVKRFMIGYFCVVELFCVVALFCQLWLFIIQCYLVLFRIIFVIRHYVQYRLLLFRLYYNLLIFLLYYGRARLFWLAGAI